MKASALRTKSFKELQQELLSLRREQFALRLQRATGQLPKPDQFGKVRRNIARVLTVQRQVRAAGAGAGFAAAALARAAADSGGTQAAAAGATAPAAQAAAQAEPTRARRRRAKTGKA
jgi:large subunit ribosomal protein L29